MKVELVNPVIESTQEIFSTMLGSTVKRGEIGVNDSENHPGDLVALIGISGRVTGTVVLSLPASTALGIVCALTGNSHEEPDDEVLGGVSTIIGLLGDSAKAKLNAEDASPIDLSLPTVISGDNFNVKYPKKTIWLEVPFASGFGPFILRINLEGESPC